MDPNNPAPAHDAYGQPYKVTSSGYPLVPDEAGFYNVSPSNGALQHAYPDAAFQHAYPNVAHQNTYPDAAHQQGYAAPQQGYANTSQVVAGNLSREDVNRVLREHRELVSSLDQLKLGYKETLDTEINAYRGSVQDNLQALRAQRDAAAAAAQAAQAQAHENARQLHETIARLERERCCTTYSRSPRQTQGDPV
ncbi:hypothetical protein DFH07DRAFT_781856 [Mycena maculata]|uniref:Uncharacterized protein n=1 Tax=Mycena maculata TaxID=230809 RepID=A0AAD7MS88_9AGAR|nr:hypothetical protein DFH07DRAFT_781856 [Mycena maculata]